MTTKLEAWIRCFHSVNLRELEKSATLKVECSFVPVSFGGHVSGAAMEDLSTKLGMLRLGNCKIVHKRKERGSKLKGGRW